MAKLLVDIPTFEGKVEKCAEIVADEIDKPIELVYNIYHLYICLLFYMPPYFLILGKSGCSLFLLQTGCI